jgi:hypothetical protein
MKEVWLRDISFATTEKMPAQRDWKEVENGSCELMARNSDKNRYSLKLITTAVDDGDVCA